MCKKINGIFFLQCKYVPKIHMHNKVRLAFAEIYLSFASERVIYLYKPYYLLISVHKMKLNTHKKKETTGWGICAGATGATEATEALGQ